MKLKKLEVNSFAGISPHSPVVLDFTNSKFVKLSGDQGVGKTSLLMSLLVACGSLSKDDKNFINLDSNKIDIDLSFIGKDNCNYEVKVTKSSFKLIYDGVAQAEPISKMKDLLGTVGTSPMEIKYKPLKDIIKWIASYSNKSPEEFETALTKFKYSIKAARDTRASANKSLKALTEYLANEPMFNEWEQSEKKYIKAPDIKELSAKLDEVGKKSDRLLQAETKMKQLKDRKEQIDEQVAMLIQEAAGIEKSILSGDKFIEENKGAKKEYDIVRKQYDNAAQEIVSFNNWQQIKKKKAEKDEFETISQKADSKEKELLQEMKELQMELLPAIKGVEIVTEDTTEDGTLRKEGFYRDNKNSAQMSESEWFDLVLEIWRKYKVKVVVLDNIGTLGSKAIDRLEKLAKDGCHILAAEMDRSIKELEVTYE